MPWFTPSLPIYRIGTIRLMKLARPFCLPKVQIDCRGGKALNKGGRGGRKIISKNELFCKLLQFGVSFFFFIYLLAWTTLGINSARVYVNFSMSGCKSVSSCKPKPVCLWWCLNGSGRRGWTKRGWGAAENKTLETCKPAWSIVVFHPSSLTQTAAEHPTQTQGSEPWKLQIFSTLWTLTPSPKWPVKSCFWQSWRD